MSSPQISTQTYPGSSSHGFAWKAVQVMSLDLKKRMAMCVDSYGKYMSIRCDIMRSKGNLPSPGEQWIVDRQFDIWTFAAIMNGTTRGVEVSNVTDLPDELQRIDLTQQQADAAQTAATTGRILAKGDLLAGPSAGSLVRQPVGGLNESLVADPNTATGLAYRDLTGRPAAFSGLPGAVAAGRYVGNTTSGSPTSGTWAVGDWVSTNTGYRWVCTVAGTPGTWVERTSALETRTNGIESRVATNETKLNGTPQSVIARSYITSSTGAVGNQALTTGAAAIRCFAPVKAGRLYRIGTDNLALAADNSPVRINAGLRISTDGTNTNSGGQLYQQMGTVVSSTTAGGVNRPETHPLRAFFVPSFDCTLSTSIVVSSGSTVGGVFPNVWIFAAAGFGVDNYIEDCGIDPGV